VKADGSLHYQFGDFPSSVIFSSSVEPARFSSGSGVLLVFDRNTQKLFAPAGKAEYPRVVLPPGEGSKDWSGAKRILQSALETGLGRDGLIVGVGGGMICDLAAFSASLFMRGSRLFLVPTSLLAMVDAAIGGKTAINLGGYKNMAGTFYPAEEIWIGVSALKHLTDKEFISGIGEAIKTALLGDQTLLGIFLEQKERVLARDPGVMEEIVRRCITVKAGIVEDDFTETGRRASLNLGHTFAHALEAETGFKSWSHGQAVAWGLFQAAVLSETIGLAESSYVAMVGQVLRSYGFSLQAIEGVKPESILRAMQVDKKKRGGKLRLVLQRGIGDTVVTEVAEKLIVQTLRSSARIFP
jgi:3-dehydroquinate synthase